MTDKKAKEILDIISVTVLIFVVFFTGYGVRGISIEEPVPLAYEVKEHYTNFSGFLSTEEYMASFQQFNEDTFWVRVSREGFDKIEFEVSTYQEAVAALENLK